MEKRNLMIVALILLIPLAGCLDSNNDPEEIEYEEITNSDDAQGHVMEGVIEPFQNILFYEIAVITEFFVIVTWEDEPDINNRIQYQNQPDRVQVFIIDDAKVVGSGVGENLHGQPGQIIVSYPTNDFNNSRLEGERNIEIHIELIVAGDQESEGLGPLLSIEDDGNDFYCVSTWKLLISKEMLDAEE